VRPLSFTVRGHWGPRMGKVPRLLIGWVIVLLIAPALLLLQVLPWHPHSGRGWTIFALAAGPLLLLGEYIGALVRNNPLARRLDALGSGRRVSGERIAYLLLCNFVVIVIGICALAWLGKRGWLGAL
jgi:hypothetical protein